MRFCVPLPPPAPGALEKAVIGGKARSLLRLAAAGLRVPPAFAVSADLFRLMRAASPEALRAAPFPDGFADELLQNLTRISAGQPGARFAVRSSFASEDRPGALAAGLFRSELNVAPDDVAAAVRAVLLSALSPAALAYTRARAIDVDQAGMAVLIHRFVAGDAAGSAAWDPASGAAAIIEGLEAPADAARAVIEGALRALARQHGPVEIEWVASGDEVTYLQMRPFESRPASGAPGDGDWRWDASHNPLPLSPAQAGLIALVDRRCRIDLSQRVVGGYLFYRRAGADSDQSGGGGAPIAIARRLAITRARVDDALAALGQTPPLVAALDTFVVCYQAIFGDLQPAARRTRNALRAFARAHGLGGDDLLAALLAGVPSIAGERRALAEPIAGARTDAARAAAVRAYLDRFGDETAVWDVAAPTFAEQPALVIGAAPAAGGNARADDQAQACRARLPPSAQGRFDFLLAEARAAVAAGEEDDHLYARAQAAVRRALLRAGQRLHTQGTLAAPADVFWLPLAATLDDEAGRTPLSAPVAATLVQQARAADQHARANPPGPTPFSPDDASMIAGRPGAGGRVEGPAFLYPDPRGALPDPASIVVARALLPTELPLLPAAGLVTETGGVLGHVAAQARERGIPAVVDAAGACTRIRTGDRLLVDGDTGTVVKL